MVIAPMFTPVHRSWEEFEQRLKEYTQATYQMYVIRTTTSVKRRNLRITENASAVPATRAALGSAANAGGEVEEEASAARETPADASQALSSDSDQVLIPESYQWYSKTLMCTHGWKDRNRGSGKRSLSIVRSTRCPAKMCVTLQHRGKGNDGWQVVLTRHVRTHNHQLSKELYLYYMENRRIYDPDLLLVGTSQPTTSSAADSGRPHHQLNRAKLSHLLASLERSRSSPQNASSEFAVPIGAQNESEDANSVSQTACRAPKILVKVHNSWEAFHKYAAKYSVATQQSFRARSTVSAAAKNAKTKTFALKAGRSLDDVMDQLIPEEERWYSKLMICNHGWKRKSRSKVPKSDTEGGDNLSNSCPAMLLARLQRDGNNNWRVVINRQVVEHNHSLTREKVVPVPNATSPDTRRTTSDAAATDREPNVHAVLHLFGNDNAGHHSEDHGGAEYDDEHEEEGEQRPNRTEIVMRVPKLEAIHASWEAFHARLQEYSGATFQLYRTRTTSSVQGRNQKIPDIKRALATCSNPNSEENKSNDTRIIPEEWKWYSKTLTCTHGWKERRRGTGKRTIQVFRSTSCPVKICATVQFVEDAEVNVDPSSNSGNWRVVVTKHVVDHNHNLSKELHQHYCENRRIYDPDLLTIDESNEAAVVKQPRQHHTFLMNAEAPSFFPQAVVGFTQPKTMHTVNDGREPSADHGQLSGSGLHPLALMADVSSHPEQMNASPSSSAANSIRKHADGVSAQAGLVQGFSAAPLISYTGAFPSGAGSHTLFPAAGNQQASPYLLHAHQYFAADQIGNSAIAQVTHSHLSAMGMIHGNSDGNDMSNIANAAANAFLGSCRVHGSGPHSGSSGQCTCLRGASPSMYYPLTNRPLQARANEPSLSGNEVRDKKSRRNERVSHGDEPEDEKEEEPDEEPNGSVVWSPGLPVEITTVPTDLGMNIWRAPRIKRLHDSWNAFQEHLDLYSVATFQLYRVRTTSSVSSRNSRIAQQTAAREMPIPVTSFESSPQSPAASRFVPDSYQWYSKTFVCTHGWKERRRGKGQRVSHSLRSTECSAKLCVTLQKPAHEMNSNKWRVVVTKQTTDHNHEISVQAYQQYSENRRIKDSSLLDQAEELWKKGLTRRKIYEFLKEQCPNAILMKDVHNLVQRWQVQQQPGSNSNGGADGSSHSPTAATGFTDATESPSTEVASERIQVLHEEHQI
uniref:FAR1 domain-containing protein n=1 Tax=Globisporangium ultimum (strain ATCC 200006 / CBS 805.95 / DAOM BR144) TaxID=431595 RepID=K3WUJ2_GLOUD